MSKLFYQKNNRKFGEKKTSDGFSSMLERSLWTLLLLREKAGEIREIKKQIRVPLTLAKIVYVVDFSFVDVHTGATVYCEAKGVETPVFSIKRRLWEWYGPSKLEIWKGSHRCPKLHEVITPKGLIA